MNSINDIKNVFYINLDIRPDRKSHVETQLKNIGLNNYQRFNAIKMTNGAIGCSMSHLKLIENAKLNDLDHILIVEDDILFTNPNLFVRQLNKFLSNHKDFDVDIKKTPNWEKNKNKILKQLNNKILLTPIDKLLTNLENLLEPLIVNVNERIASGENRHIKIRKQKNGEIKWTLPYPKKEESNPELNNSFFDNLELVDISDVFDFVNQQCNFIDEFVHFKPKNAKVRKDYVGIKGVILANATTHGIYLFSKKSKFSTSKFSLVLILISLLNK